VGITEEIFQPLYFQQVPVYE